jgi:hypothetical protein
MADQGYGGIAPLTGRDHSIRNDMLFLAAWEDGQIPWPWAMLRIRQIYRANPVLSQSDPKYRRKAIGGHPASE